MTALVFGANGQLGRAFAQLLGQQALFIDRVQADFSHLTSLANILERHRPTVVINAAAYTQVDKAESERELAFAINAHAPEIIATWCARHSVPVIHFSTDYVFNGSGTAPWRETDMPDPLNTYGQSKLAGEQAIMASGGSALIFRTSWVYDAQGKNFLNTMLNLGKTRETLRVVADQFGAPTYAPHLAKATLSSLAHMPDKPRIYHLCHGGETSWHGFAEAIFTETRKRNVPLTVENVLPIATEDYPAPATRPKNSRLNCARAKIDLNLQLPSWQEGLAACMSEKYA